MSLGRWRARQLAGAFCHWRGLASSESWQLQVVQHFAARRQQQLLVDTFTGLKQQVGSSDYFTLHPLQEAPKYYTCSSQGPGPGSSAAMLLTPQPLRCSG